MTSFAIDIVINREIKSALIPCLHREVQLVLKMNGKNVTIMAEIHDSAGFQSADTKQLNVKVALSRFS